ncbi:MAG TPA: peptide chain release factor N(5)-glutamine methyltransferase [Cellulomonas sp.]
MTDQARHIGDGVPDRHNDVPDRHEGADPAGDVGLRELVEGAVRLLDEAGVASARHDALALAAFSLRVERVDLVLAPPLPDGFRGHFAGLVARRARREPLQHIVGSTGFRYVTLAVEPGVFVPRPETEVVAGLAVDEAAARVAAGDDPLVVDLCTGSGAIAVAVATEVPAARVVAVDLSLAAVGLATRNAQATGAQVRVLLGDVNDPELLAELTGSVDIVVANPPYIPPDAEPTEPEVRDHDPDLALYGGGADGLDTPRAVLAAAARLLRTGGLLVVEHAEVQAEALREAARATGAFGEPRTVPDLTGRPRALLARRTA